MEEYMERRLNVLMRVLYILPLVLVFLGCVAKIPLQTPVKELSEVGQDHGVVVGSVRVRGPKFIWGGTPRWTLNAKSASDYLNPKGEVYEIKGDFGDEQIFVTRMPVGEYYFTEFVVGKAHVYIDERFTVHSAKTVYIGRLAIEVTGRYHTAGSEYLWGVEDAQEQTLASAEEKYGRLRIAFTDPIGTIELPVTFDNAWCRPGGKGSKPKGGEDSGVLTIGKDAVVFHSKERQLTISYSSILDMQWGSLTESRDKTLSALSLLFVGAPIEGRHWVIVRFRVGGSEEIAAFTDENYRRGREMYRTLEEVCHHYGRSEGK
jgi:hypothetical protein